MYFLGILTILAAALALSKGDVDCSKPPPYVDRENCCQIPDFIIEDTAKECMNEVREMLSKISEGQGPPPEGNYRGPHSPQYCFMSCVIDKTGILVDGELQDDNLNDYLKTIYDDSEMIDFIDEIVHKCNEKRQNRPMKKPINRHGPFQCPFNNGGMLGFCTFNHAFNECPDSFWTNTDECNELREHFRECKQYHHGSNEDDEDIDEDDQAEEDS